MSKKKPPPSDRHSIHIRLNAAEEAALEADLKAMPGVPVSAGTYAKHAVLSYPKLRKMEQLLRQAAGDAEDRGSREGIFARLLLDGAMT